MCSYSHVLSDCIFLRWKLNRTTHGYRSTFDFSFRFVAISKCRTAISRHGFALQMPCLGSLPSPLGPLPSFSKVDLQENKQYITAGELGGEQGILQRRTQWKRIARVMAARQHGKAVSTPADATTKKVAAYEILCEYDEREQHPEAASRQDIEAFPDQEGPRWQATLPTHMGSCQFLYGQRPSLLNFLWYTYICISPSHSISYIHICTYRLRYGFDKGFHGCCECCASASS